MNETFKVKRSYQSYAMFVFMPLVFINLFNILRDKNDVIEVVVIVLFTLVMIATGYYLFWIIKHKDDTFVLEIMPDFIQVGAKRFELDTIKSIQISNSTLWIRVHKSWSFNAYLLEPDKQETVTARLKDIAGQKGVKFRVY